MRTILPGGDEPHYLVIAESLRRDGDLAIDDNHERGDYLAFFRGELTPDYLRRGVDRRIYSIHAPGLPALLLPAYAAFGYAGAVAALLLVVGVGRGACCGAWCATSPATPAPRGSRGPRPCSRRRSCSTRSRCSRTASPVSPRSSRVRGLAAIAGVDRPRRGVRAGVVAHAR